MNRETFMQLFDYCRWANHRVWECVMELSNDDFYKPLNYSVGSIQAQVFHTMQIEHWWPHFLRTGQMHFYDYAEDTDRDTIRALWDNTEAENKAYIAQLTDEQLERLVHPGEWEVEEAPITVRQALYQVLFHSMDHRAQTLAMLHTLGAPTVEQDFLSYLHDPNSRVKNTQNDM
jgi:uncharacterized damage-inducible protein DinB